MPQPPQPPDRPPSPPPSPPAGGGRERDRRRKSLVVGAAVAALFAVGAGVWAAVGHGGGRSDAGPRTRDTDRAGRHTDAVPTGPSGGTGTTSGRHGGESGPDDARRPGEARVLFRKPAPQAPKTGADIPGFWVMDGYVVKPVRNRVIAYGDHGEPKWTVKLRDAVCAVPESPTDGKVVIAYRGGGKDECGRLALIDLDKGVKLWDRRAPYTAPSAPGAPTPGAATQGASTPHAPTASGGDHLGMGLAQSGDLVGLSWYGGSAVLKVDDGRQVSPGAPGPGCDVDGFAGGRALLRAYSCDDGTAGLQRINTSTDEVSWTYPVRKGYKVSTIFSTAPVVIALADDHHKSGGVLALSDRGKRRSTLELGKRSYQPECGLDLFGTKLGGCRGVAVSSDTLYLPTELTLARDGRPSSEVHAFDLRTGQRKWAAKVPGRTLFPLSVEGGALIAYEEPTDRTAGSVVGIGTGGGRPRTLLRLPNATRGAEAGLASATRVYRNGVFYIASDRLTGSGAAEEMIMAFCP
ncbi:hypothetical protein B7755_032990 [Streptomyces sp. NBS 14/10]|uniref:outer membrane protein assembly factor BamB family protein n=1 Tax=Streptomyces sp. NBS 14/10 TaxID=1945643 RepID=UPI000B7FCC28|nr:PQQ-binding-like beta-propeller repeat protein [Streptomyces sp. NBS 14/10]KAK1182524.1 hypothetical protein B7755_032990 [Streptomyces sp. NBS 14/10]